MVQVETRPDEGAVEAPVLTRGRRDRKKLATRQALRLAAVSLVAERGYAHVTAEDIAEAADVSTRTFFNYFPSKESALVGIDPAHSEQMRRELLDRPAGESPLASLRAVVLSFTAAKEEEVDSLGESKETWLRRLSIVRTDPDLLVAYAAHTADVERMLVSALRERLGTPANDPYPAMLVAAVLAVTRIAALYWCEGGGVDSLARLSAAAVDELSLGLTDREPFATRDQLNNRACLGSPTTKGSRR